MPVHLNFNIKLTILFFLYFILTSTYVQGQRDTIIQKDTVLEAPRFFYNKWNMTTYAVGVVPEVQGFNDFGVGMSVAAGKFTSGEGAMGGTAFQLGIEYLPFEKIFAPKAKIWTAGWGPWKTIKSKRARLCASQNAAARFIITKNSRILSCGWNSNPERCW